MNDLALNFPEGYIPRKQQAEALTAIQAAFNKGKKFVILHADTGVGKTHIAKTLGNASKEVPQGFKDSVTSYAVFGENGSDLVRGISPFGCYALTITKSLQDQYETTFNNTGILKGQTNYQCDVDTDLMVDVAPCLHSKTLKMQCWRENRCPYYNKRNEMLQAKFSVLNYSMFFALPEHLKTREIMVCDEGSELEDQLVSQFTCEIDIPFLMKTSTLVSPFPSEKNSARIMSWLQNLSIEVTKSIESYKSWFGESKRDANTLTFAKKRTEYTRLNSLQNSLDLLVGSYYDSEYIIQREEKIIRFIPLKVNVLSKRLFQYAEKVVILSATIIDPAAYCKSLGIEDYEYIHIDTDFDPEKSPIYVMVKQRLNYANLKTMLPELVKQIKGIMEHHKNEKGLIHTHTQFIADYIRENIHSNRLLCREAGVKNEDILEIHAASEEPTILVSPSMSYGVDLAGDLGKFQIIMKAPWLPTKDPRVEKLMKSDKVWYGNAMLKTLVQASGRSVRSAEDECETYILDGSVYDSIIRNKEKLPKFFLKRFK